MKKYGMTAIAAVLVLSFAAAAFSQVGPGPAAQGAQKATPAGEPRSMARSDKNGDGLISKDEWPGRPEIFQRLDANGDGYLDSVEIAAAREKARERVGERREGEGKEGQRPPMSEDERMHRVLRTVSMFAAALFRILDEDNDGKITKKELDDFTKKIEAADADHDGNVTRDEARIYFRTEVAQKIGERFMEKFDANKDGKVTRDEWSKATDEQFKRLDANGDGVISMDDFLQRAKELPKEDEMRPSAGNERQGPPRGTRGPGGVRRGRPAPSEAPAPAAPAPAAPATGEKKS